MMPPGNITRDLPNRCRIIWRLDLEIWRGNLPLLTALLGLPKLYCVLSFEKKKTIQDKLPRRHQSTEDE